MKNVVLFEENSILPLPERLGSSELYFLKVEVSQEGPKIRKNKNLGKSAY